jgi:hypothetical protein
MISDRPPVDVGKMWKFLFGVERLNDRIFITFMFDLSVLKWASGCVYNDFER